MLGFTDLLGLGASRAFKGPERGCARPVALRLLASSLVPGDLPARGDPRGFSGGVWGLGFRV